jgi:uncharacterized protein (DUF1330 family)
MSGISLEEPMPKGYWVTLYRSVSNPAALAKYAQLAVPAIQAGGGRFLVRGVAVKAYEGGLRDRCVVIEFDSVEKAIATYESAEYQSAMQALDGAVERDVRMVEGA